VSDLRLFDVAVKVDDADGAPSPGTIGLGVAAEMLLVAALLERGHKVAVPIADDDGVDVIVDYRLKVQVKSSAYRDARTGNLAVVIDDRRGHRARGYGQRSRGLRDHVDVVAVYARDTGTWWHVPRDALPATRKLRLNEQGRTGVSAWRGAWDVYGEPPGPLRVRP
jgi:hypothetical protein